MSPSRRSSRSSSRRDPELLIDRSLGSIIVPDALRACGLQVQTLRDVYGEHAAQAVPDSEWLALAGERGWSVLMKDRVDRLLENRDALAEHAVIAFCLTNRSLTGEQMAEIFVRHRHRIVQRINRGGGPRIYGVYADGVEQRWPRD